MMMRHRLKRLGDERGFTLIELIVVMILIAILAAIALAVFLRQADKGLDTKAKSDVTNVARLVQACNAGRQDTEDFRDCDTKAEIGETNIPIDPTAATAPGSDCDDDDPGSVASEQTRVAVAGKDCFVVVGLSKSGNKFWFVKHDNGDVVRKCTTPGVTGCGTDGHWGG
jgi:prepilin-type N-terminal cleavage/methylation domain-containing protein